jgi:putative ABC transport system permease protein
MTRFGFVIANLFRKKTRGTLTLLSVVSAFLLFGLLQSIQVLFNAGADFVGATRVITQARVSFTQPLPMRLLTQLESVPGVTRVMYETWFGGVWQTNTPLVGFATDPVRLHAVYPEWVMPDDEWRAFAATRTGMIVGRQLANQFGWKIGQKIPIASNIWPRKDGSKAWAFDLVGIFDGKDADWQRNTSQLFVNFGYFDEENQIGRGLVNIFVLKLASSADPALVARTVDTRLENSADETKTQTEREFNTGFVKQIGDIGLIVRWILAAVFFTLLLVVGNTMAQSVRERVPELAVLKTLGFSDLSVLGFVIAEAAAFCLIGGLLGLGLATGVGVFVEHTLGAFLPLSVDGRVWMLGLAAIVVMSLAVGVLPALRAKRLSIVDALAGR